MILWGHGPELLFQPPSGRIANGPCGDPGDDSQGLYITPIELRNALQAGIPQKDGDTDPTKKPRIISMDACSMSMFEVAYEIRNYAEFMVASQEEVPDLSFPYDKLVDYFRAAKSDAEYLCKSSVEGYGRAYQDYIFNMNTGMKNVTLSAIRLRNLGDLETALKSLADALYDARDEKGLPGLLIDARERSMGYAGGLYVDICNFCDKLQSALAIPPFPSEIAGKLKDACNAVCKALRDEKGCILTNQATDSSESHGLSIYFPYMKDEEIEEVREPLVKGGTDTIGKGFTAVMNRAASNVLLCVRRQLIVDTEGYYGQLNLAKDTNWYRFIVQVWSRILAGSAGHELDLRYSAQQSAVNLPQECFPRSSPWCARVQSDKIRPRPGLTRSKKRARLKQLAAPGVWLPNPARQRNSRRR